MRPCLKRKSWVLFLNIYLVVESVTIPPNEMTCGGGGGLSPTGEMEAFPLVLIRLHPEPWEDD